MNADTDPNQMIPRSAYRELQARNNRLREQRDMALGLAEACATFIGDHGHEDEARRVIERASALSQEAGS